jgi:outer membrane protein assembly factor BamB
VAADTQVTAYNRVTGTVLWRTKAPLAGQRRTMFCGASQSVSGSMVVLGIGVATDSTGDRSDCHSVVSLNVATGKLGWLQQLPSAAQSLAYGRSLAGHPGLAHKGLIVEISGQTVVAGWLGVMAGFSLTSGAREWTTVIGGGPPAVNFGDYVVKDIAVSGADTYVAASAVYPAAMKLLRIDTATGTVTRAVTLAKRTTGLANPLATEILSAAPLTVVIEQFVPDDSTNVVSFSSDLVATRIVRGGPQQVSQGAVIGKTLYASATVGNDEARQFYPFTLGNGLLAAATLAPAGGRQGNRMVAFDDATGATKWTAAVPGTDIIYPVAVTGTTVEVVGVTQSGQGNPVLIRVDAATGKVVSVGKPRVLGPAPLGQAVGSYRFVSAGGHVYGVYWSLSAITPGSVQAVFSLS